MFPLLSAGLVLVLFAAMYAIHLKVDVRTKRVNAQVHWALTALAVLSGVAMTVIAGVVDSPNLVLAESLLLAVCALGTTLGVYLLRKSETGPWDERESCGELGFIFTTLSVSIPNVLALGGTFSELVNYTLN